MGVIIDCLGGDWSPTMAGRGFLTWVTVLAYLACTMLAAAVWRDQNQQTLRRLWGFIAILVLFLAVNKVLDLQSALNETARCVSKAQGWHRYRRYAQLLFIIIAVAAVIAAFIRGKRMMQGHLRSHWMALTGTALVCAFVLVRASSLHRVDAIISVRILGLSVNFLIEIAGLMLIALNAIKLLEPRIREIQTRIRQILARIRQYLAHRRELAAQRRAARRQKAQNQSAQNQSAQNQSALNQTARQQSARRQPAPSEDGHPDGLTDDYRPFRPLKPRGR